MISIFIAILALAIGVYVGSIVFGKEPAAQLPQEPDRNTPMVTSSVFRRSPTKHTLVEEVLRRQCYSFMSHFGIQDRLEINVSKKYEESLNRLADAIMQWWNPEYNELLLVAHQEPNSAGFVLDWTWKKPSNGAVDELGR